MDARLTQTKAGQEPIDLHLQWHTSHASLSHLLRWEPRHRAKGTICCAQVLGNPVSRNWLCTRYECTMWHPYDIYNTRGLICNHGLLILELSTARELFAGTARSREELLHHAMPDEKVPASTLWKTQIARLQSLNVRESLVHDPICWLFPHQYSRSNSGHIPNGGEKDPV